MYEAAISALIDRNPELAILLIAREMKQIQQSSDLFELEIKDAVEEIKHTTDFLKLLLSFETAR